MLLLACGSLSTVDEPDVGVRSVRIGGATVNEGALVQLAEEARTKLMSINGPGVVGRRCGIAPEAPDGWLVVRSLVAAGRSDLLRLAMNDAPTPEGRLWAAYALYESKQVDDASLVEFAHFLPGEMWTCDGCFVDRLPAERALERLYPPK
jgi:hypothetical protein